MPVTDDFDTADFYDCRDSETLTCESVTETIEGWLDGFLAPGCDTSAIIREGGPIEVTAFRRTVIPDPEIKHAAEDAAERAEEILAEEYADPDGDGSIFPKEARAVLEESIAAALRVAMKTADIWACQKCGKRTYSVEEVEKMMRDENPDWWDEESRA